MFLFGMGLGLLQWSSVRYLSFCRYRAYCYLGTILRCAITFELNAVKGDIALASVLLFPLHHEKGD